MKVKTLYDRTDLVRLTTTTVRHVVLTGLLLVTLLLLVFLGDVRISLIAALTIPCSLLFAFSLMVLTGRSANLISLGAVDFGILVDAAVIVLENVYRQLHAAKPGDSEFEIIASAAGEAVRPVLFSVLVIDHGVDSPVYDARRAGQNFRTYVDHLWVRADGSDALCDFSRSCTEFLSRIETPGQRGYAHRIVAAAAI